jgi:hypothetical protein
MNVRILVRRTPRIASTRKNGARRTIDPAKDLRAMTQDQSPASASQRYPRNFRTETLRRTETASRFAAPSIRRHLGCDFASGPKKRTHAISIKTGGENTDNTLRMVSNPSMIGEYASKGRLGPISPANAVISMGRRNTKLEPAWHRKQMPKSLVRVRPSGTLPWLGFAEHSQTDGSPAQPLSNQCTGWCCIDRLSWQRSSGP